MTGINGFHISNKGNRSSERIIIPTLTLLVLMLLSFTLACSAQLESCDELPVTIEEQTIFAEALNTEISFSVYLPACLDERAIEGYPVLYLLHGQDMGKSVWQEMGLQDILREGIADGSLPLFIIVTPQEDNYLASILDSGFGRSVLESVIPWVDEHYNTCTERSCRAVGGISRGALWAEALAFEYPDVFSILGMHSMPGVIFDDQSLYALASEQSEDQRLRVSMDVGNEDNYRHEGRKASDQLNFIGYEFIRTINPGGHNTDYWHSQLKNYLEWYSTDW